MLCFPPLRIFRRRRKARRSLASLFSDMTETCQSWLDEKVFGGVRLPPLAESSWMEHSTTDLDTSCSFTYGKACYAMSVWEALDGQLL